MGPVKGRNWARMLGCKAAGGGGRPASSSQDADKRMTHPPVSTSPFPPNVGAGRQGWKEATYNLNDLSFQVAENSLRPYPAC